MEFLKGDIYKLRYTSKLANIKANNKRTRWKEFISKYKIILGTLSILIFALIFDCTLIYRFFYIIENIK